MDLDAYRKAMRPLRPRSTGQRLEELPADPDVQYVPAALRELEGKAVTVSGIDRSTGELVHARGSFTAAPGIHGDLARRDQDCTR
jgi:hypothetical protein